MPSAGYAWGGGGEQEGRGESELGFEEGFGYAGGDWSGGCTPVDELSGGGGGGGLGVFEEDIAGDVADMFSQDLISNFFGAEALGEVTGGQQFPFPFPFPLF